MENAKLSRRNIALNFNPLIKWPESLPIFLWRGQRLCAFDRPEESPSVDLTKSAEAVLPILADLYGAASVAELSRLYGQLTKLAAEDVAFRFEPSEFFEKFQIKTAGLSLEFFQRLANFPESFQRWMSLKKSTLADVRPLTAWPDDAVLSFVLEHVAKINPTRAEGAQMLELLCELHLMGEDVPALLQKDRSTTDLLLTLRAKRYPMRALDQRHKERRAKSLPWSRHARARWNFQGDRPTLVVELNIASPEEFKTTVQTLDRISGLLENEDNNPWS